MDLLHPNETQKSYLKHIGIGAGAGTVAGGVAGHLTGRAHQAMLAKKAREEASRGILNKTLNAINGNRLKNIENAAKRKISLTEHTLVGAGLGALGGAAGGAGTKYFRDKIAQKKQAQADMEARAKEIADLQWKSSKEYKDLQKKLAKDEKERMKIVKKRAKNIDKKKKATLAEQRAAAIAYAKNQKQMQQEKTKAKKPSSFGLSGGNPNSERNLQGAVMRTYSYVGFSKEDKIRRGNELAEERTRQFRDDYRRVSSHLKVNPLKGAAIGSLVGAGLASSKTAISHERQVRELAKKLRKQNSELEYDESIKKARAVLGSLRHKLKDSAIKGAIVGGTAGGLGSVATNAVKSKLADKAEENSWSRQPKSLLKQWGETDKISKYADNPHKRKMNRAFTKLEKSSWKLMDQQNKKYDRQKRLNSLMDKVTKSKYEQKLDAYQKYQQRMDNSLGV